MYYLYRHIRLDKNQPFYIGIGTKKKSTFFSDIYSRALDSTKRNKYWKRIVEKTPYEVEIMYETDDLEEIREKEIYFIAFYGKTKDGGILCNLANGGQSNYGYKHSEEYSQKCRERMLIVNPTKGRNLSVSHRNKIAAAHIGMKASKETMLKAKNRKYPIMCVETNEIFNNAGVAASTIFRSDKRYLRVKITESARTGGSFKNYTFKWLV